MLKLKLRRSAASANDSGKRDRDSDGDNDAAGGVDAEATGPATAAPSPLPASSLRKRSRLQEDHAETRLVDAFPTGHDLSRLALKPDHERKPLWITPDGRIFLETFSPFYAKVYDFLITIAEPKSRPLVLHEYELTTYSLYGAVSAGLQTEDMLRALHSLAKNEVPQRVIDMIRQCTATFGKAKLVLQGNSYFIESVHSNVLQDLLRDPEISRARVKRAHQTNDDQVVDPETGLYITSGPSQVAISGFTAHRMDALAHMQDVDDDADDDVDNLLLGTSARSALSGAPALRSFEVRTDCVTRIKQRCDKVLNLPLLEEYDFRRDTSNASLDIDLKPTTTIRPYQEKSLSRMFSSGRARSGIIVLPCGAGKTLVGITACSTIKRSTLVLCTSSVAVEQWRQQFHTWTNVDMAHVATFTRNKKEMWRSGSSAGIIICTYSMITHKNLSAKSRRVMDTIQRTEWGLIIMDEVHVVPADMFRSVLDKATAHCKLGLTATLVREDEKIQHLNFLIGPKLYEANWMDLAKAGYIAKVQCAEVWCPMTPAFMAEYLKGEHSANSKVLIAVMNPMKIQSCDFLIRYHEARNDKILVFSDRRWPLKWYAQKIGRPFIHGDTSHKDRQTEFDRFRRDPDARTLFVSKIGDNSIDLPGANVLIQISFHGGSRRQEAQRLGRLLRPKGPTDDEEEFNAFFYSLVSRDTREMYFSLKRQKFLVEQGYNFKVITKLPLEDAPQLKCNTLKEQMDLLTEVELLDASEGKEEELPKDKDEVELAARLRNAKRSNTSMRSGGTSRSYAEKQRHE